ncbi:MAG: hypothetical protein ACOC22_02295 [bacterium]
MMKDKIPEINIKTTTKKIGGYGIDDMERMFGKRIEKAIYTSPVDKSGRCYTGLIHKEIRKLCKWWKFWNKDIAKAYKNYQGMVLVPFIIQTDNYTVSNILLQKNDGHILQDKY